VLTIAGPGCTKTAGMKSLTSAPWPAMALAKTASTSETRSVVPRIVTPDPEALLARA
jgi:hypothetical protein